MHPANFFWNFFHYFYIPKSGPWYAGNIWGNVFVLAVAAPLGWIWSKTKYFPLHQTHELLHIILEHHKEQRAHNEWVAEHIANLHMAVKGVPPAPHPVFDKRQLEIAHQERELEGSVG